MNKLVFIIGLRRSGSSILRTLIEKHPEVSELKFEPHELLFTASTQHINRYKDSKYHQKVLDEYRGNEDKYFGAKLVVNPGLETFSWKFLPRMYPEAKFIFINRIPKTNYDSWIKQDKKSVRGIINRGTYNELWCNINYSFIDFTRINPDNACILSYEVLCSNTDKELEKVWKCLDVTPMIGLNKFIKQPEFKS